MIGRYRGLKPSFFQHGDLYDLEVSSSGGGRPPLPIRLAFAGLWCWSDREGRFEWKPRELKLNILPYDPVDFTLVLDALAGAGFVVRYESGGKSYGWIPTFTKHQNINGREQQSELPAPPPEVLRRAEAAELLGGFHQYSGGDTVNEADALGSRVEDASVTREARVTAEGKGNEGKGNELDQEHVELGAESLQEAAADAGAGSEPPSMAIVAPEPKPAALPAIEGKRTYPAIRERLAQVAAELIEGTRARLKKDQLRVLQGELVFGYWCAKTGHEKAIYDPKRERVILKQLEMNGGNVSELLFAIDGSLRDDHLQGRRPDSVRKYDGIETIFRDRAQVERLAEVMPKYRAGKIHVMVEKHAAALSGGSDAST